MSGELPDLTPFGGASGGAMATDRFALAGDHLTTQWRILQIYEASRRLRMFFQSAGLCLTGGLS